MGLVEGFVVGKAPKKCKDVNSSTVRIVFILSNVIFLIAMGVAVCKHKWIPALFIIFTFLFSTFYHTTQCFHDDERVVAKAVVLDAVTATLTLAVVFAYMKPGNQCKYVSGSLFAIAAVFLAIGWRTKGYTYIVSHSVWHLLSGMAIMFAI